LGLFASMDACLGLLTWRSTLRPVDTRRVLGAPPACTSLCVGAQVRVKGLSNTASNRYNGLQGTIVGRESKRWIVRARGLGEDLVLRGRNLEITGCIPRTSKRGPKGGGGGEDTRDTDTPTAPENVTLAVSTPALDVNQSSSASASAPGSLESSGTDTSRALSRDQGGLSGVMGLVPPLGPPKTAAHDWRGPIAAEEARLSREAAAKVCVCVWVCVCVGVCLCVCVYIIYIYIYYI
jgi:hypothetical protein